MENIIILESDKTEEIGKILSDHNFGFDNRVLKGYPKYIKINLVERSYCYCSQLSEIEHYTTVNGYPMQLISNMVINIIEKGQISGGSKQTEEGTIEIN